MLNELEGRSIWVKGLVGQPNYLNKSTQLIKRARYYSQNLIILVSCVGSCQ
ncbi:hypothetical protein HanIR_Chr16g0807051 [Helianthus annuus]|nr:hypothetical protein HanIR_Chr16g0807051 [Helianthus annuus]